MRLSLPEQVKNHEKPENEIIQVRGPGNSAFLIEMIPSKDVYEIRFLLKNFILVKHGCRYEEPGMSQFERHGYVLTKPIEDFNGVARKASVHVKEIGAEEVIEMKKEKQLKFLCSPAKIFVTAYKLSLSGYEIESSGVLYFPKYVVGLKKNDKELCDKFLKVMNQLPNVKWSSDILSCRDGSSIFNITSSTGSIAKSMTVLESYSEPNERGDAESQVSDSDDSATAVAESPAKTQLFEVKGPNGTAFLIEVHQSDLEEVKADLIRLKGEHFRFDKTVIGWFTMKCILTTEPPASSGSDRMRLARIHAISSGCEDVYHGSGKIFFVNSVERTIRAKRILQRFGYKVSGILYRFQSREKASLDDRVREICNQFVTAVEKLPKVISITHNL